MHRCSVRTCSWMESMHSSTERDGYISMQVRADIPPTLTTKSARALGVLSRDLYACRDSGEIIELSRGVSSGVRMGP